jgi:hypothetical protein
MGSVGWETRLNEAQTAAEVIAIAQEFIAHFDGFELAQLPIACRPRPMTTTNDVTSYAFDLLEYETTTNDGAAKVISVLATFFAYASNRLARFHGPSARMSEQEVRSFLPRKPSEAKEP